MASNTTADSTVFPEVVPGTSFMLAWRLAGKKVLLVGGGLVASGRLFYLLEASALVTLISPSDSLHPEVHHRIFNEHLVETYHDRKWSDELDIPTLKDFDMVLTAIDDNETSKSICQLCRSLKLPVNVADVPPECDFYFGSQIRRGPLQVMVSTSGRGPKIASLIRKRIEASLPSNVEQAILSVGYLRSELRKVAPGTGGELGQRRMGWMIKVCDQYTLDELSAMDEATAKVVLEGWEKNEVISFRKAKRISGKRDGIIDAVADIASGGLTWGAILAPYVGCVAFGAVVAVGVMKKLDGLKR